MTAKQNVVGPQVRKLRYQLEMTQEMLAARCATLGWDVSRESVAKLETGLRCVTDVELVFLAKALKVNLTDLYPPQVSLKSYTR
jgi:DNA-binding XRE family transcriptional regulator